MGADNSTDDHVESHEPLPSTIQFQGRWVLEGAHRCATWCGSSVHFRTMSRSIILELGDLTTFRESKPDHPNILWNFGSASEPHLEHVKGRSTLILEPEGGANTDIHKDSEVLRDVTVMLCDWGAALHILNIYTTDGQPIVAPKSGTAVKPLLFIGASLVSGFSPLNRDLVLPQGTFQSFPCVAARTLQSRGIDVRLEMVAYPGLRLTTTQRDTGMEDIFWDGRKGVVGGWETRSKDSPDDIFICIGSNDRAWGENLDKFLEHYKAFIIRLRNSYGGRCKRIYVISPFGSFHAVALKMGHSVYEPEVQHMVEELGQSWAASGPEATKLYHISTEGWIDKSLTCDKLHPTAEGHEKIAAKLVEFLDRA